MYSIYDSVGFDEHEPFWFVTKSYIQGTSMKYLSRNVFISAVAAVTLAACGGDGGAEVSTERPEGTFGGTLVGSASNDFSMLILENGELWSLYGTQTSTTFFVNGFVQGSLSAAGTSFSSSNARDYGFFPALTGSATGSFNKGAGTISGTVSTNSQSVSFTGGPIVGSLYNYNTPASLATVSGTWTLDSVGGETISLTVQTNGNLTASTSLGCNFTGAVTPRASGKNVFDATLTFGPAPCALPNQSATGIALAYPISGGQTQLLVAVQDASRSAGTAAFGAR